MDWSGQLEACLDQVVLLLVESWVLHLPFGRVRADDCSEIDLHREDRRRKILLDQLLSGTSECETDKYRPCTKESKVVITEIHGVNYEPIDTPGLGEGGAELDHLYLEFIDQYLIQDEVSPIFVFKSDDRLRSEDYSFFRLFCKVRQSNFQQLLIFLTFAGNLEKTTTQDLQKSSTNHHSNI